MSELEGARPTLTIIDEVAHWQEAGELHPLPMPREEARALVDEALTVGERFHDLLLRIQEGRAWESLGYGSWRELAVAEFGVSKTRAYELVTHAKIVREIEAGADSAMAEKPNERQSRELAKVPEGERAEVWQRVVVETEGKPTAKAIREAVTPPVPRIDPFAPLPSTLVNEEEREAVDRQRAEVIEEAAATADEKELLRRQRVATDLIDAHIHPLALMCGSEEMANYTSRLSHRPITHEKLDKAEECIRQIRKMLTEKGEI